MKIEKMKVKDLIPYENNAKLHPKEQIEQIVKSIKEFGFNDPIAIDENNVIIEGHGRLLAIKQMKYKECEVIKLTHLTAQQKKAYILAHNKLTLNSDFDLEMLEIELCDIDEIDMSDFGFDLDFMDDNEGLTDEDDIPEVQEEPTAKRGQIWKLGNHRLMCGDSTKKEDVEKLMDGEKADMVFTDPPFPNNSGIMEDMIVDIDFAFKNARNFCDALMIWFWDNISFPNFEEMITSKCIWHKTNGWQSGHYESMYLYHNDNKRHEQLVFNANSVGGNNKRETQGFHQTPKPIELILLVFDKLKFKNIILDLFLGSGSTLIACEKTNRKCYGMELDEHYCDVIIKRWEDFTGKKSELING